MTLVGYSVGCHLALLSQKSQIWLYGEVLSRTIFCLALLALSTLTGRVWPWTILSGLE